MTDSILLTIKKMLGIAEEYHAFDIDLVVNINSVFLTLNQLGVGPESPYHIGGEEETWNDFLAGDRENLDAASTYTYLKTRLLFDPPTNSFLVDAIQKQIDEFEWRLKFQAERLKEQREESEKVTEQASSKARSFNNTTDATRLKEVWKTNRKSTS